MKSHIGLALVACLGMVAVLFAGSSGPAGNSTTANSVATAPRFTVQGEGDSRLMFDSQTGETWVMKTVLQGVTDFDPSPIVVWFPVPRADDSLVKAIVVKRSDELIQMQEGQASTYAKFLAEKEGELGREHPDMVKQREELERGREVLVKSLENVQSVFVD